MAFKTATVQTGKVASTQSNFPVYVDLDRLGITTLAEAESVRVYADEAKTTEWAREIVSVTEMHVKVPSLTSSTEIYVDYDGVRSDYAVGATYGRNAVWSDFVFVFHFEDNLTDSAGNITVSSSANVTYGNGTLGRCAIGNGSSTRISLPNLNSYFSDDKAYLTVLAKLNNATPNATVRTGLWFFSNQSSDTHYPFTNGIIYDGTFAGSRFNFSPTSVDRTEWHKISVSTQSGANNWKFYQNKQLAGQNTGPSQVEFITNCALMCSRGVAPRWFLDGNMDEARLANFTPSLDWIETEYNNQNAESTFWGTWTDAGGGGGGAAQAARRGAVMMM